MPDENERKPFKKMSRLADMDEDPDPGLRRVAGPANALLITACLALALNCAGGIAINAITSTAGDPARPPGMTDEEYFAYKAGKDSAPFLRACAISIPTFAVYPLAILGALRMKQRNGYGLAMLSAFLVMLPCSLMFVVGVPVGCWAIVVLRSPEVRAAFA